MSDDHAPEDIRVRPMRRLLERADLLWVAALLLVAALLGVAITAAVTAAARPTRTNGRMDAGAGAVEVSLSPTVPPAVQVRADCVNRLGPAMDGRGWVRGGDVLQCRMTHRFLSVRVYLWYWHGDRWVQVGSAARTMHDGGRLDVITTQKVCGWGWAPYWRETADFSVAEVGSFHHEDASPGYHTVSYMHSC